MNKQEAKTTLSNFADKLINGWFPSNSLTDILAKAGAKTIIKAKVDEYDNFIDLFSKNGHIMLDELLDNLIENFEGWQLDLTEFNIPILPNKIIIISKQDLIELRKTIGGELK